MRWIAQPVAACTALAVLIVLAGAGSRAATSAVPAAFTDTLVASVANPTAMTFTADGRILVTAQFGELRVIANDALLPTPALDISSALCTSEEQGILGVERDPNFAANGFVYLYYTHAVGSSCENRVSRFTMSGNVADPASELVLIDGIPSLGFHNAGDLHFGPDGYLYVSVGDGGCDYLGNSGCAEANDASRDENVLLGKILRITSTGGIPAGNPYQGADSARCAATGRTAPGKKCQETFARGLRNPFRITFDSNDPGGRFFINDVGQNVWEEVDLGAAGADYGWNLREGPCVTGSQTNCGAPPAGMTNPVFSYVHDGCNAITGGAFVPNGIWPAAYDGTYLYGDYVCGKIFLLTPAGGGAFTKTEFATGLGAVVNLGFGPAPVSQAPSGRALYYTNYAGGGEVRRIAYSTATNRPPTASVTTSAKYGPAPLTVSFDAGASADPDTGDTLAYDWSFGDGTPTQTTTSPQTTHTYTASANVTATLTVRDNHGASASTSVQLYPGDTPPQPAINSPAAGSLFSVGQTLTLSGSATDAQDGTLPPASLSWRVLKHHSTHTHPFLAPTTGNAVTIAGPAPEDLLAATNSYLEIELTATDSRGLTTVVTRDVQPRKVNVTLATNPTGLQVSVNSAAQTAPQTLTSWEGWALSLNAPAQTDGSGKTWLFSSWSDGGAASHSYVTPASASTVTATFTQSTTPLGLVGAWGFSEGSGTVAGDSSGTGNAGALSGPAWTTAGKFGSGLTFNGVNDWVSVPDAAALDVTRMTLEAWVRPTGLGAWRSVLMKERPGGIVYSLYASDDGGLPVGQVDIGGERTAQGTSIPVNAWTHLAVTYDGTTVRLYINGVASGTAAFTGSIPASTGLLRIGGNSIWGEWFQGTLDELRVYNRALSPSEIQGDMNTPVGSGSPPADTQVPDPPDSLAATVSSGSVDLAWQAATDNVGVTRYDVFRSTTAGFAPATANRIAQVTTNSYRDVSPAPATYFYRVIAVDAAGNSSLPSNEAAAAVPASDTQAPTAPGTLTATAASGSVDLAWQASTDNVGVTRYDVYRGTASGFTPAPANRIAQVTVTTYRDSSPPAGTYYFKVIAADAAGNTSAASNEASATVTATPSGLVGAWGFSEGSGTLAGDASGAGNKGTIAGPAWTTAGKYGSALTFDGVNDWVTVPDAASLDLTRGTVEAWVRPTALGSWRTVLVKERPGGIVYSLYASQATSRPVGQVDIGGERNAVGPAAIPMNAWTHLAVTYDGTTVRLYVNGAGSGTAAFTGSIPASTGVLRIGGNSIWSEWFKGSLDELRVYNRALTQAEIQADMNRPI